MCGFAGFLAPNDIDAAAARLETASAALRHRGPDGNGTWMDRNHGIGLAHRRLAILDLDRRSDQPMSRGEGRGVLVYNGELYNFRELRDRMTSLGIEFTTTGDTEVVLAALDEWGPGALASFRGMFALAYWDRASRTLLLARDRVGKKPLYLHRSRGGTVFASEISALRALVEGGGTEIDRVALGQFLLEGFAHGEKTLFKGIRELPRGHAQLIGQGRCASPFPYGEDNRSVSPPSDLADCESRLSAALSEAVDVRVHADVPVGIFLSGGIDSGLVTSFAAERSSRPVKTFCVRFSDDHDGGEVDLAAEVADRYGTEHHVLDVDGDVAADLEPVIGAYGEPLADPSILPTYFVARRAAQEVKVVLNGDGGDEVFLGYRRHLVARKLDRIERNATGRFLLRAAREAGCLRQPFAAFCGGERTDRAVEAILARGARRRLILTNFGFLPEDLPPELAGVAEGGASPGENLRELLRYEYDRSLPGDLLVKMDIATMAHSLEARSPFLDWELVRLADSVPPEVLLLGGGTKAMLRRIASRRLPKRVCAAPKRGFEAPLGAWFRGPLRNAVRDFVLAPNGLVRDVFSRSRLEKWLEGSERSGLPERRWLQMVWSLLVLAVWDHRCLRGTAPG